MRQKLSYTLGHRLTKYPAAVVNDLRIIGPDGQAHRRRWDGVIDTGADLSILPAEIVEDLRLSSFGERVHAWTYHKDQPPRHLDVYFVDLELADGLTLSTAAITSTRHNILIGRSALQRIRLTIDWPANTWSLENATLPRVPPTP